MGASDQLVGFSHVRALLEHCRLEQYAATFEEEGYDDLPFLRGLEVEKLKGIATAELGMKPGHAAKLIKMMETYVPPEGA